MVFVNSTPMKITKTKMANDLEPDSGLLYIKS